METNGQQVGYIRVSSIDQNTARQLEGIALHKRFEDKLSGAYDQRPALQQCLTYLREGDTLHLHSIDRLARNLADLEKIVTDLNARNVTVIFHNENLTFAAGTNDAMQTLVLQMLGAFAQFERAMIRTRQQEGIAAAKAAGKRLGRAPKLSANQITELKQRRSNGESVANLAVAYGISRQTANEICRRLKDDDSGIV
jgi:DNA invertase Pin-like site-specific DNA recombinase